MKHRLHLAAAVTCMAICIFAAGCAQEKKAAPEEQAAKSDPLAVAESWLAGVDQGKYAESWDGTSEYFRGVVPREQLVQQLTAVRKPMGDMVSRTKQNSQNMTSMQGAPDGEYVLFTFKTEFTNKKAGIETLTVMMDDDWKVAGYYIK